MENFHICYGKLCNGYKEKGEPPSLGAKLPLFSGPSVTARPGCSGKQRRCYNAGFVQHPTPLNPALPYRGSLTGGEAGAQLPLGHPAAVQGQRALMYEAAKCWRKNPPEQGPCLPCSLLCPLGLAQSLTHSWCLINVEKPRRMEGRSEGGEQTGKEGGRRGGDKDRAASIA